MKMCDKTCIFFFFPIINKNFLMAKRSLLSRCPSYLADIYTDFNKVILITYTAQCYVVASLWSGKNRLSEQVCWNVLFYTS